MKSSKFHLSAAGMGVSRRRFLQLSAAAGVAGFAGARLGKAAADTQKADVAATGDKIRLALVGCGGQGSHDMLNMLGGGAQLAALCDVDELQIAKARLAAKEAGTEAKAYGDYRKLLEDGDTFDAVVVATPDHWHATLATAFMKAGKHVFCEKPLAHSIGEVRALRELSKTSKVVTQMGNQGSASASVRRGVEIIKAGALGQVREVYIWLPQGAYPHGIARPTVADPIPATFNWDFWLGPAPVRPYSAKMYHPWNWRAWYDFGSGQMGDWGCHALNMAVRGLDLTYPTKIELQSGGAGKECNARTNKLLFHFPARNGQDEVNVHWSDGGKNPGDEIVKDLAAIFKKIPNGCMIIGDKGKIYSDGHNLGALIKLENDERFTDINHHPATKDIPKTLPRVSSHYDEFLDACRGVGKTYSDFETGGHLTEIALAGVVALRMAHTIEWDGPNMKVLGKPDADKFIHLPLRKEWSGQG